MEKDINDIDDLIGKVLANEASTEEQLRFSNWVQLSEENRHHVIQMKVIFDRAASNTFQLSFDEDVAWHKIKSRLTKSNEGKTVFMTELTSRRAILRIAASIMFFCCVGMMAYFTLSKKSAQIFAVVADTKTIQDSLPDGSAVFLNKKSSITYESNLKKTRKVNLKGEGFFEVKHEEERPFVVEAEGVLVRDIGTSFNVKAYPESDTIVVTVQTGEVQIYTLKDKGLNLKRGETGMYSKYLKQFTRLEKTDTNILSYKTGLFSFNSTDLKSVIEKINEVYDSRIKLDSPSLDKCPITVDFHGDTIDTIIEVIAETLKLTVIRKDNEIILKGTGCNQ